MNIDYIITGISVICTGASIWGAWKSISYYKKSKNLTIYANNNAAYIESQKIISLFGDLLKFATSRKNRGVNVQKEISQNGETIKKSIDNIREKLSVKDFEDIEKILCTDKIDVEKYIDSIITCTILQDNIFPVDENYYAAQKSFHEIHKMLKNKITQAEESLV